MPKTEEGKNPFLVSAHFVSQLAGSGVFFQVMSGLTENPVRVIIHDRLTGERKMLIIEVSPRFQSAAAVPMNTQQTPTSSKPPKVSEVSLYQGDPLAPPEPPPLEKEVKVSLPPSSAAIPRATAAPSLAGMKLPPKKTTPPPAMAVMPTIPKTTPKVK